MSTLRRTPLHRALYRPNLILGGERELVLITAIICSGVAVSGLNLVSMGVGLTVWLIAIGLLQMMAKADPHMSKVYLRQLHYGEHYPARAKPMANPSKGVADLLPWATLMADGIVINKDGSLLTGWFFLGPDVASSTPEERNHITRRMNAALAQLGSGWAVWFEACRMPAASYPPAAACHFDDPITALIDEERRMQFLAEGAHFETEHALLVMYTPPLRRNTRVLDVIYDDDGEDRVPPGDRQIETFSRTCAALENGLLDVLRLRRMGGIDYTDAHGRQHHQDELVNFLHVCLTGGEGGLNIPPCAMHLDGIIGGQELWPGDTPRLGDNFIACVAIEGFPAESFPFILDRLIDQPFGYRIVARYIPLDAHQARAELARFRRKWTQRIKGFVQQIFAPKAASSMRMPR